MLFFAVLKTSCLKCVCRESINDFRRIIYLRREIQIHYSVKIPASLDFVYFSDAFNVQKLSEQEKNKRQLMRLNTSPLYHNHPPYLWSNLYSMRSVGDGFPCTFIWQLDFIIYHFTHITIFPQSPLDKQTLDLIIFFLQCQCYSSKFSGGWGQCRWDKEK